MTTTNKKETDAAEVTRIGADFDPFQWCSFWVYAACKMDLSHAHETSPRLCLKKWAMKQDVIGFRAFSCRLRFEREMLNVNVLFKRDIGRSSVTTRKAHRLQKWLT